MTASNVPSQFVRRSGASLTFDGEPYRFAGANCYYLMVFAADPSLRHRVEAVLDTAADLGLDALRTWAFASGPGWNSLRPTPDHYEPSVLRGLDFVVAAARRRGLRLILTLTNYWPDYGGMDQYVRWSPTAGARDDFYVDPWCREHYLSHLEAITTRVNSFTGTRYADEPVIMAWELANEPRCPSDVSGWRLMRWLDWAGRRLRDLAPNQLIGTGSEGFWPRLAPRSNPWRWRRGQGADFVWHHELSVIDFASAHLYPDHWYLGREECLAWIEDHVRAAAEIGKPMVFGEFGKRGSSDVRAGFLRPWLARFERLEAAGSLFWSLYDSEYPDYDGFGIYPHRSGSTGDLLSRHARAMRTGQVLTPDLTRR